MANPAFLLDLQHSVFRTRVEINSDGPTVLVQSRFGPYPSNRIDVITLSQRDALELANAILAHAKQEAA